MPPKPKKRKWIRIAIAISVIAVLLVVALALLLRYYLLLPALSGEMENQYRDWYSKPIDSIPASEIEVVPFSEKTRALSEALGRLRKESKDLPNVFRLAREKNIKDISPSKAAAVDAALEKYQPLMAAYRALVSQPDYSFDALPLKPIEISLYSFPEPDPAVLNTCNRLLALQAVRRVRQERFQEALELAEIMVRSSKIHDYSDQGTELFAARAYATGADIWNFAVEKCDDAALIRHALTRQNGLARGKSFVFIPQGGADQICAARRMIRAGFETRILGLTGCQLSGALMLSHNEYCRKVILPRAADGKQREKLLSDMAMNRFDAIYACGYGGEDTPFWAGITSWYLSPIVYVETLISNLEITDLSARVSYDLLRLNTAWKLFQLEKGRPPLHAAELVPEYLSRLPEDLFNPDGGTYPRGRNAALMPEERFYSVGPDGIDGQASKRFVYDPRDKEQEGDFFLVTGFDE